MSRTMPRSERTGSRIMLELPDVAAQGYEWPELAAAIGDYRRMTAEMHTIQGSITRLTGRLEEAHRTDREALARAIRAGTPEPVPQAVRKVEADRATAQRRLEAVEVAIDSAYGDLVDVLESHRAAWLAQTVHRTEEARQRYAEAVEAAQAARRDWVTQGSLARWVQQFPETLRVKPGRAYITRLTRSSGDAYTADEVLAALRDEAEPRERVTPEPRPLKAPLVGVSGPSQAADG